MAETGWIAVDWGRSDLRLWALGPGGEVLAERRSGKGAEGLAPEGFEPALLELAEPLLAPGGVTEVVICGMAGARRGWAEAPCRKVPCAPGAEGAVAPPVRDARLAVRLLPGLSQSRPGPDVMRGGETRIAGFLAEVPDYDGILCLPGPHTRWAHVSAGEVVSFTTFMTGELFGLLAEKSVLRHGLAGGGWDAEAFAGAVEDGLSHPQRLGAALFGLRAAALLEGLAPATARARLWGLLTGLELAGARPYWLGRQVVLIGDAGPRAPYAVALAAQGVKTGHAEAGDMALAGLRTARRQLRGAA